MARPSRRIWMVRCRSWGEIKAWDGPTDDVTSPIIDESTGERVDGCKRVQVTMMVRGRPFGRSFVLLPLRRSSHRITPTLITRRVASCDRNARQMDLTALSAPTLPASMGQRPGKRPQMSLAKRISAIEAVVEEPKSGEVAPSSHSCGKSVRPRPTRPRNSVLLGVRVR